MTFVKCHRKRNGSSLVKSKSEKKNGRLIALVILILLLASALSELSLNRDDLQVDSSEIDPQEQNPELTYDKNYWYIDEIDGKIEIKEPKLDNRKVRGENYIHPLTNDTATLFELDEIALGTLELEGYGTLRVFDDIYNQLHEIHSGEFPAQNEKGADMVRGNFDSDPAQEIALSYEIDLEENGSWVSKTQVTFLDDAKTGFELLNSTYLWITYAKLTCGDFDGDGLDEVAVVGNREGEGYMQGVVFDDLLSPVPYLHKWDHQLGGWEDVPNATREHDIASGDFDSDGRSELVTVGRVNDTLIMWVWEYNHEAGETYSIYHGMKLIDILPAINFSRGLASVACGNIDFDPADELIVTTHDENFKLYFRIHDDLLSDFDVLMVEKDNITIRTTSSKMGDVDGDGLDEILVVGHHVANPVGRVYDDAEHGFDVLKVLDIVFEDRWYYWYNLKVDCADVDGDNIEEYMMFGQSWWQLHGELYDDLSKGPDNTMLKRWITGYKLPAMTMGNFDGDGFILEYSGEKRRRTTSEVPIVLMAAPPQVEGSSQNKEKSGTGIGTTRSGDPGLSISTGLSFSFEGTPIEMASGVRSALHDEFARTETPIGVEVDNISFKGMYPSDYVIYQNATYDVYTYKIISWPGHDDRAGENITINVPVNIELGYVTLEKFVSIYGDLENGTFSHVPGILQSYPDLARRNSSLNDHMGWFSEGDLVGQGGGYLNVKVHLENEQVEEDMKSFGRSWEYFEDNGEYGSMSTAGFSSDMMYQVNLDNGTEFQGMVGEFKDNKESRKHGYSFGMFVYQRRGLDGKFDYLIVNYWVEGYEGHLDPGPASSEGSEGKELLLVLGVGVFVIAVIAIVVISGRKDRMK